MSFYRVSFGFAQNITIDGVMSMAPIYASHVFLAQIPVSAETMRLPLAQRLACSRATRAMQAAMDESTVSFTDGRTTSMWRERKKAQLGLGTIESLGDGELEFPMIKICAPETNAALMESKQATAWSEQFRTALEIALGTPVVSLESALGGVKTLTSEEKERIKNGLSEGPGRRSMVLGPDAGLSNKAIEAIFSAPALAAQREAQEIAGALNEKKPAQQETASPTLRLPRAL